MSIQLKFTNNSQDQNNSSVVIFQKNVATDFGELAAAWQVIKNSGQGDNQPFTFPVSMQVGVSDGYGNDMPQPNAQNGLAAMPGSLPFQPRFAGGTPVGSVIAFAGPMAQPADHGPDNTGVMQAQGWMLCDGRTLAASQYPELFAVLGYCYGGADGLFQIPDYRGSPLYAAQAEQGQTGAPPHNGLVNYLIRFAS